MHKLEIEWTTDTSECDQPGCSGGWADGATVKLNGEVILDLVPVATCFGDGDSWHYETVYKLILEKLGYEVIHND